MPSADFCSAIGQSRGCLSPTRTRCRPPGVSLASFAVTRWIYSYRTWWIWTSRYFARSSVCNCLVSSSCSSGHGFAIASFRHHLAMMPLRVASTSPPPGCTGDLHPQHTRHARHTIDIGRPSQAVPVTPPCVRNRTRRFDTIKRLL